ncbi:hypothetical protein CBR_g27742 [Chara braunii]|uniref:MLO-like protein n=1 Tax=Chara braunii TaxID=69332 RepID=A0A388L893_CHABU|nr:hypothetical protein CBR_g27742 [Chara braunii]|eukprot:GBG78517.1 hypothetical protein CBR_g27742 [Chara braunii]
MAGDYGGAKPKNLELTPTYRVAIVVFVFVAISLAFEKGLHHLAMSMKKRKKKGLYKAVEVVKDELMLLGFISLILTIFQGDIAKRCVRKADNFDWLPCTKKQAEKLYYKYYGGDTESTSAPTTPAGRHLLATPSGDTCAPGHEPFMSYDAMHYVHYFIFILAIVQVVFSSIVFVMSFLRIRMWRNREEYAQAHAAELEAMSQEERLRWAGLKEHRSVLYAVDEKACCPTATFWLSSFCMLFFRSVYRENYQSLRLLFISKHNLPLKFDFHEFLTQSLEEDFAKIVGLSVPMWVILMLVILTNVGGANLYLWSQLASVFFLIVVGTHLLGIMRTLTRESSTGTGHFVAMDPRPTDELFWFSKPSLVRHALHYILFLNCIDISSLIFFWWKFGLDSCLLGERKKSVVRITFSLVICIVILHLCAYVILPIYALVSQMGSEFRGKLLSDKMEQAVTSWMRTAKSKAVAGQQRSDAGTPPATAPLRPRQLEISTLLSPAAPRSMARDGDKV